MNPSKKLIHFSFFLVFYEIVCYFSNDSYLPAIPQIAKNLATTDQLALLTFTAWFLGSVIVQPILGPLSDRYGRRPILLIGGAVFIFSNLFCASATNIYVLIVARLIQGMTVPSMIIAGYAAIHESFEQEKAIHVLARMNSITIIAPALGPLFGAIILSFLNWHWIFLGLAMLGAISVGLLFFKMPETLPIEKREQNLHVKKIMRQYQSVIMNVQFMRHLLAACFLVGGLMAWMAAGTFIVIKEFDHTVIYFACVQAVIFSCFIIGTTVVKKCMKNSNIQKFITAGMYLSLLGGMVGTLSGYFLPNLLYGIIFAMMLVTVGAGLSFSVLLRLTIESSEAPMGIRMTIVSSTQMASVVLCSGLVSFFYYNTVLSFAWVVLGFSIIAYFLKPATNKIKH